MTVMGLQGDELTPSLHYKHIFKIYFTMDSQQRLVWVWCTNSHCCWTVNKWCLNRNLKEGKKVRWRPPQKEVSKIFFSMLQREVSTYVLMLSLKNVHFFQAGIGILANAFLLVFHIFRMQHVSRPKPTDMTTCQLAFVHIIKLLTSLDIFSVDMFTSSNFANELKCKLLFYLSRVMRGLSISTTCLLSIIQVITISPSSFCLSRFKQKLTKHVTIAFFCLWSLNLSFHSNMIIYTVAHSNRTNLLNVTKYCSLTTMNSIIMTLFFMLAFSQSALFVGMMLLSSVYMVVFLCSHQRKSEYLHSMSISPRISPAKKATCTVLVLVSFFVIIYCVDIIIASFSTALWRYEPVVLDIQRLVGNIYATLSPLLFITSDKRVIGILKKVIDTPNILTFDVTNQKI